MKKCFTMLAVALFAIGCQKDNSDESLNPNVNPTGRYTNALSIKFGTTDSRGSFDNELKWSWSAGDEIIGYQNSGEKERNTLSYDEGTTFSCDEFTYATTNAAKFHFIYPASAEQSNQTLVAEQSGTWNPILVGSTAATTLQNIGTVQMQHLTSALEVRAPEGVTITAASLTSENDFVGCWSVKDDLTYTQTLSGTKIELTELSNSVVVFNMPVLEADEVEAKAITLHLTTSAGVEEHLLPAMAFEAGKRTLLNIRAASSTLDRDKFRSEMETILTNNTDITAIAFKAKSSTTSSVEVQATDNTPIYLVENGTTLEVHTAAREFMAPENCFRLFENYNFISSIDLSNFNTSEVTDMFQMFFECRALSKLDLSNFDTSEVTDMNNMFCGCNALTELDLSSFDTSMVTDMGGMFSNCESLTELDLSNFNTSEVTDMTSMFSGCSVLEKLDLSRFDTSNVVDMSVMFSSCSALTTLNVGNFDTSKVTDMYHMFSLCKSLTKLDLSNFNTSMVTDMGGMFTHCESLTELDLSNLNTSKVTDMTGMFTHCESLTELDLSNFDTSVVTDMNNMFCGCYELTELDLSNFDTSEVTDMNNMFCGCYELTELDLSNFDTSEVTDMNSMFYGCYALTELDLSSFDFNWITDNQYVSIFAFVGRTLTDPAKCTIWVSDDGLAWTTYKELGTGKYEIKVKSMPQ